MYTQDSINDQTGFANGEEFTSEQQVREYFTEENMKEMFGESAVNQSTLDEYADTVIQERWHSNF